MTPPTRVVALLARAPSAPGKTRLTDGLHEADATALRAALFLDTLDAVRAADEATAVFYTPHAARDEMASLCGPETRLVPQAEGDLGARMAHVFDTLFADGVASVVLTGSDLPSLPAAHVREAFARLAERPLVLGPSGDGGYYLIGLRAGALAGTAGARLRAAIFHGIPWSTGRVHAETLGAARRAGVDASPVPPWDDVDTVADLGRLAAEVGGVGALRTRAWARARRS